MHSNVSLVLYWLPSEIMDTTQDSPISLDYSFPGLPPFIISQISNLPSGILVDQIWQALNLSIHNLNVWLNNGSMNLLHSKVQLGILWTLTISSRDKSMSVRIIGQWEDVIWKITELAKCWLPCNNFNLDSLDFTPVKPWILTIFSDPEFCHNPHLRLEMLRFVGMWPETYLEDATSGMQAAAGLVSTCVYMKLDHLMPGVSHVSLFYALKSVLKSLNKYGHLDTVAAAAVDQVKGLKVGPEASFFNHLAELLKQKPEAMLTGYQSGNHYYSEWYTVSVFVEMMHLYRMLVFTTPTAYGVPGLAQAAAGFLVTLTSSIVTMWAALKHKNGHDFKCHVAMLDDIYKEVSTQEKFTYFYQSLVRDHAQYLSVFNQQAADFGCSFNYFPVPCQESSSEFPEEFMDSVTQAMMEAPVLLHSSRTVIDESTLVHLLLESPFDPFSRRPLDHSSFSRLPHLQAEILARRNAQDFLEVQNGPKRRRLSTL